jgi:hypothetical protein
MFGMKSFKENSFTAILATVNVLQGNFFVRWWYGVTWDMELTLLVVEFVLLCFSIKLYNRIVKRANVETRGTTLFFFGVVIPFFAGLQLGSFYMDSFMPDFAGV